MTVSSIEAARTTRLFDLWLEQWAFDYKASVRLGQLAADDEFMISEYGGEFINATYGWPALLAADLPSGGPAYPLATPAVRLKVLPTEDITLMAALFNGDPAGPGEGNPQLRDASGTAFRTGDGQFWIGEAAWARNQGKDAAGLPATYKVGGWYHNQPFADERFASNGFPLDSPHSNHIPQLHQGHYGFYGVIDQALWRRPETEDQGLGAFLRFAVGPEDRSVVSKYVDGGFSFKGLIPSRGDDIAMIGFGIAKIGSHARESDADLAAFTGVNSPVRGQEVLIELSYKYQIAPYWSVQPDLQIILDPGGGAPLPSDPTRSIPSALVIGVRTALSF
jgi:porin